MPIESSPSVRQLLRRYHPHTGIARDVIGRIVDAEGWPDSVRWAIHNAAIPFVHRSHRAKFEAHFREAVAFLAGELKALQWTRNMHDYQLKPVVLEWWFVCVDNARVHGCLKSWHESWTAFLQRWNGDAIGPRVPVQIRTARKVHVPAQVKGKAAELARAWSIHKPNREAFADAVCLLWQSQEAAQGKPFPCGKRKLARAVNVGETTARAWIRKLVAAGIVAVADKGSTTREPLLTFNLEGTQQRAAPTSV